MEYYVLSRYEIQITELQYESRSLVTNFLLFIGTGWFIIVFKILHPLFPHWMRSIQSTIPYDILHLYSKVLTVKDKANKGTFGAQLISCWIVETSVNRSIMPFKFWSVLLETKEVDQLDVICEDWRSVTESRKKRTFCLK